MPSLAICLNPAMDISEIWGLHLRAIVDRLAPGEGRGVKTPAYHAIASATRFDKEYVYQAYKGYKRIGKDFAAALGRAYGEGRPEGWINVAPQQETGATDELVPPDHSPKGEGLGLNEFLNYLTSLYPMAALTPEEVIEEAEAYREFAAKRVANRLLKHRFQAPGPVSDERVEAAYGTAQARERRVSEQQLIDSPMRRSTDKKRAAK